VQSDRRRCDLTLSGRRTIHPHEPQRQWQEAKKALTHLIQAYQVQAIAIGNGTASRETEALVTEVIGELPADAHTQGMRWSMRPVRPSIRPATWRARSCPTWTCPCAARLALPALTGPAGRTGQDRSPVHRRGLYQHDVDPKHLGQSLDAVVESVVNYVGVDLNTASPALLSYVAG